MRAFLLIVASFASSACAAGVGTEPSSKARSYSGTYTTQVVESTVSTSLTGGGTFTCTNTYTMSGTLTMTIDESSGAMVGSAQVDGTQVETAHAGGTTCLAKGNLSTKWSPPLKGTSSALTFDAQNVSTNGSYVVTSKTSFSGALSGGVVTGVLGFSVAGAGTIGSTAIAQTYNASMSVSLR